MRQIRHRLGVSIGLILASGSLMAANLSGRVVSQEGGTGFAGAEVKLVELNRSVETERDGSFRLQGLAAGTYTLEVRYVGADTVTRTVNINSTGTALGDIVVGSGAGQMDNILVIGQVAGQAAAINRQRNADTVVSIVASDAIGQFPDQNTTEALQRLPGVSITRDQGEGRYVAIRGIDPNLNAVTIQGARVPSPERDSRNVQLDVIPSELLESLEVYKTATPDMDADGIGGTIEIKSLSALDRPGMTVAGKLEAGYNEQQERYSPKASATLTNTWGANDAFGVAISASSQRRKFGSDNQETDGYTDFELPSGAEVIAPDELEQRDYVIQRDRDALTLNFDWLAGDSTQLYLRTLWSDFSDSEVRTRNEFRLGDGNLLSNDNNQLELERVRIEKSTKLRLEEAKIWSTQFGGSSFNDLWTFDYNLAQSHAEEREPNRIDSDFRSGRLNVNVSDFPSQTPLIDVPNATLYNDPAFYEIRSVEISDNFTEDDETALKLDARREMDFGVNSGHIKFGLKSRWRDKDDDQNIAIYDDFPEDYTLAGLVRSNFDYPLGHLGLGIDPNVYRNFVRNGRADWGLDEVETAIANFGGDYRLGEDVHAAYLMAGADVGDLNLIAGVRVERTEFEARGNIAILDNSAADEFTVTPVNIDRSYTDVLPGLHLRWRMGSDSQLRASYTESVVRAGFRQLAPSQLIEIEEDDGEVSRQAEIGNPNLDPLRARNVDLMLEHYQGGIGVLTAGLFYKDIRDFVVMADIAGTGPWVDYDEVLSPVNGNSADLWGLELGWVHEFEALPGLLLNANAAWTDSDARLPFRSSKVPLPFQSDLVANLALGYETGPISLRLSGSYRDKRFIEIAELDDPAFDLYEGRHFQVDFSAKYRLSDKLRIYFEATNLNDEPFYTYVGRSAFVGTYEEYGPSYALGLQFNY